MPNVEKIIFLFLYSLCQLFISCRNSHLYGYKLEGDISGLENCKIFIQEMTDSGLVYIDSTMVQNNKFLIIGKSVPQLITLWVRRGNGGMEPLCSSFMIENSDIKINGSIDNRRDINVTGSSENEVYKEISQNVFYPKRFYYIHNELYRSERTGINISTDSLLRWNQELYTMDSVYRYNLIKTIKLYPNNYSSLYALEDNLQHLSYNDIKDLSKIFNKEIKNSKAYKPIDNILKAAPTVLVGEKFKKFNLPDSSGQNLDLSEFKSQLTLVDFWASWCGPCRRQIPMLKKIYSTISRDRFDIVGISIDSDTLKWKRALKEERMPWSNLIGSEQWAKSNYLIISIPYNFLVDDKGKIIAKNLSPSQIKLFINKRNKNYVSFNN